MPGEHRDKSALSSPIALTLALSRRERGLPENLPSPSGRGAGGDGDSELFAKPDDRWEVNNVASRCREVVECLQDVLAQYELTLPTGRVLDLPPLSDVLRNGL